MEKIIIVDDSAKNGLRIAEQLQHWIVQENLENEIELNQIFLFKSTTEEVDEEKKKYREKISELGIDMEPICLWNFDQKLDECMDDVEKKNFLLIDFLLLEDGSNGVPEYRVNIRYARRQKRERKKRLFFYTLSGLENFNLLCQLVGAEHVLPSKYENEKPPCLDLQNIDNFRDAIQEIINNE